MKNRVFSLFLVFSTLVGIVSFASEYNPLMKFLNTDRPVITAYAKIKNSKITIEEAKDIALKHAKVAKSNAKFTKIKSGNEDGIAVYEIEFYVNNAEYEYDIDVNTGKIVNFEIDND